MPASSSSKPTTFGQRVKAGLNASGKSSNSESNPLEAGIISSKHLGGGGMEMSFIPQTASRANVKGAEAEGILDDDWDVGKDKGTLAREAEREKKKKGIEEFGAGMERGGQEEDFASEEAKQGRMKRRTGGRMASGNTFRKM